MTAVLHLGAADRRSTAAPALAIAAWRNLMAAGVLRPGRAGHPRGPSCARSAAAAGACACWPGCCSPAHFAAWVPSVTLTSVASSTALVATQPVWAALLARGARPAGRPAGLGRHRWSRWPAPRMITGADVTLSTRAVVGDVLALLGGMLAAAYVTAGRGGPGPDQHHRRTRPCATRPARCCCAPVCLLAGQPLTGYDASTWLKLAALTVGAQLLGHSLVNVVLRTTSPTVVSLAILFEAPGAALIAAVWLDQLPPGRRRCPGSSCCWSPVLAIVIRAGSRGRGSGRVTG